MIQSKWHNLVIKGSCTPKACGGNCCKFRNYTDAVNYTESWCEYFDQVNLSCTIYETRPDGCRRYPEVGSLMAFDKHEGCGYYVAQVED